MTAVGLLCGLCGAQLSAQAKFCVRAAHRLHGPPGWRSTSSSMGSAAAVGAERLREIMTELVNRTTTVRVVSLLDRCRLRTWVEDSRRFGRDCGLGLAPSGCLGHVVVSAIPCSGDILGVVIGGQR